MNLYEKAKKYAMAVKLTKIALDLNADIKEKLESLVKDLDVLRPGEATLQRTLLSALQDPSFGDVKALMDAVNKAYSLIPATPEHEAQKQNALDLSKKLMELGHQQAAQKPTGEVQSAPTSLQPSTKSYPTIAPETQKMLNELLFTSMGGNYVPIVPDGKLGPDTKKALDMFSKEFNSRPTEDNVKMVHGLMAKLNKQKTNEQV